MLVFNVPVSMVIDSSYELEADSPEEAVEAAKAEYGRRHSRIPREASFGSLAAEVMDSPDIELMWPDPDEVDLADDEG